MKVVIVGGVAGGASAAARIRRLDERVEIKLFERTGYISYANCGLPYYIGDVITNKEDLTLQTPESFFKRFRVDVHVRHEVIGISPEKKTVCVHNLETGELFEEEYDKLILSPGAKPTIPNMKGVNEDNVFTLRSVEDTFYMKEYMEKHQPKSVAIIGGGFIGIETAENLKEAGLEVTIIQHSEQLFRLLDKDMAMILHAELEKQGIKLMLNTSVTDLSNLSTDMIVLAIGVTPDTKLAKEAGLELGMKGSILVNERMETSVKDIYAVGDAIEVRNFVTGEKALISLAGPANKQGRIVADNICGGNSIYKGSQGSSVIKVFDLTIATTGINEKQAKAAGFSYESVILSPMSHASYYPGGSVITMKVIYDKDTEAILGAQILGNQGVDKRIDVIATAIRAKLKATELAELDLAYAPPYASAKDPINMAGFIIENIITGKVKQFYYDDVKTLQETQHVFLLDARTPEEYAKGFVAGFINIPLDDIRDRMHEIPKNVPIYVMCQSGLRSYLACRILTQHGYDCYNFAGGYRFYNIVNRGIIKANQAYSCGLEK